MRELKKLMDGKVSSLKKLADQLEKKIDEKMDKDIERDFTADPFEYIAYYPLKVCEAVAYRYPDFDVELHPTYNERERQTAFRMRFVAKETLEQILNKQGIFP